MSFQQGLSGLNTSARALDVIGNNIANSTTVGFKSSEAHFADVYAASLTGGSGLQVGIGTTLSAVAQQFTQGNISTTNNPLDIAINGNGFFRLSNNGSISYSRNGQFHLDKSGYFTNDQGLRLTGYPASQDGTIQAQTPAELQLTAELLKLSPVATGQSVGGEYAGIRMSTNLDSRSNQKTWTPPTGAIPNIDPTMYNYSTALSIYDSLGNPHTMSFYFVKTATAGQWEIYGNVDGTLSDGAGDVPNLSTPITVTFDSNGRLTDVDGTPVPPSGAVPDLALSVDLTNVATNLGRPDWGATSPLTFNMNLGGTTQYGSAFSTNRLLQDGYSSGNLAGLGIGADGVIQGRYSNGQTRNIGQMVLASFQNPNGLANIGGNQWIETSVSGQPTVDVPGAGQLGAVQSNAVEESNVDLTAELVKMITQQRSYQANAQTIKTQDQVMQTLVNLR
ncbi:MAG: flagellar hook protein FlgE [Pseudomonas sp.]|nr:flagellar hook protein FlgE [Pseudomonas sp.]